MTLRRLAALGILGVVAFVGQACSPIADTPKNESSEDQGDSITACAKGATLKGVDVSEFQGHVDWAKVKASGRAFAFARVSDGVSYPDQEFSANWAGIKSAGLIRGAYQYFRPGQDAVAQADLMLSKIGTLGDGDLPPVLDVETNDGVSNATVVAAVRTWVDHVKKSLHVTPILYGAQGFWDGLPGTSQFSAIPLWVANYGPSCPYLPSAWSQWVFWQSTDAASVPGIGGGVDGDQFNGSLAELRALTVQAVSSGCDNDLDCTHGATGAGVVCANTGTVKGSCIDGCHGDDDCAAGGHCDKTKAHWQCTNALPALGTKCAKDADCDHGISGTERVCGSSTKTCIIGCHGDTDCSVGTACEQTGPAWFCAPPVLPLGAACTSDAQCGLPGQERVCGSSSHVCLAGCHLDSDCSSGKACDHTATPWSCSAKKPPAPGGCPVLSYPSGIKVQTVPNAATTASYQGHLNQGQSAPKCFLDIDHLDDPVTHAHYDLSVKVSAHFALDELVGTEVHQGWGNFVLLRPEAVQALESFRKDEGVPVDVISGFRGPKHQESICNGLCGDPYGCAGTCSNNSRHMWGDAFDLPLDFYNNAATDIACQDGFKFTFLEAGTHLHVDQNPAYAQCVQQ